MQFKTLTGTAAAAAVFCLSTAVSAATINFDQSGAGLAGGSVSYAGGNAAMVGSDIGFNEIGFSGSGLPSGHDSSLTCSRCTINFTTGSNSLHVGNVWTFDGNSSSTAIELTGSASDGSGTIASGTLFSGSISEATAVKGGTSSLSTMTFGTDEFNADLTDYFGLDPSRNFKFMTTTISLENASFVDGGFSSSKFQNADVSVGTAVPEPQTLAIFGLGVALLLGGLFTRRKASGRLT